MNKFLHDTIELVEEIPMAARADEVWAILADYRRDTEWRTGVLLMEPSPGPLRLGTTTTEVMRLAGMRYVNEGVVTALEPGHRLAWRTTSGATASGMRSVEQVDDEVVRVRLELRVTQAGSERVLAPLLGRMLRRNLRRDLRRLRAMAETPVPVGA
jgi:hypothetical protein